MIFVMNLNCVMLLPCHLIGLSRRITTPCETFPTLWKFKLNFRRAPGSDEITGFAMFKRRDIRDIAVYVYCVVSILGFNFHVNINQRSKEDLKILPGDELYRYILTVVPNKYRHLLYGEIEVAVQICIRNCHRYDKAGNSLRPILGRGPMKCSKL
ncbi:hypothetical protein AVEN_229027-1 [Araneus ventricosus]|uniref:Uncharacterized protein n=1 Tax=Araneus ventricosus TaxID=182803 RepID=A0A4Y2KME6_ARAVE|nr:hypothetical protein AVEN_229027-1 [Araneus ventricosus]